jgi:hypothetical protein
MANLGAPLDRGELWKEVSDWPSGYTNDGVFGIIDADSGKKYIRTKKGLPTTDEVGIYANGNDMTARINAVFALSKVKTIEFHCEGAGNREVLVTGTVTIPSGKTLKFRPGTTNQDHRIGRCDRRYHRRDRTSTRYFSGTKNVNPVGCARDYCSVNWWGANNGVDENGAVVTFAIQCININQPPANQIIFSRQAVRFHYADHRLYIQRLSVRPGRTVHSDGKRHLEPAWAIAHFCSPA